MAAGPGLEVVRASLSRHRPVLIDRPVRIRASVAMVLAPVEQGCELLMIERADVEGDRWSGDIAFPGGRAEPGDRDLRATAERETHEELGIDLGRASLIGRIDDLAGTRESIIVSAFVYALEQPPLLALSREVKRAFWRSLPEITDSANHVEREFAYAGQAMQLPSLRVLPEPAPALWGLSYRFLELFMERLGHPIPSMPWTEPGSGVDER